MPAEEYGEGFSALPTSLEVVGNLAIPHGDNCVFIGELAGLKTELQEQFMDPSLFECQNDARIEIYDPSREIDAGSVVTRFATGAMALVGVIAAMML